MGNVVKNSEGIYNFKNKIINIIKEEQGYSSKSDEKTKDKSVNLKWTKYPDNFENLINEYNTEPDFGVDFVDDNKSVNLKNIGNFINDILSGKINNKYDAEDEYVKKIKDNEDYLNSVKLTNKLYLCLKNIFKKTKYAVFGILFPSQENSNKETDGKDMPPLEAEEEAEKGKQVY